MSIPRLGTFAVHTMFMLSGVIILLGTISLLRLPVDLMPDVTYPSITVRVGYAGVGPLEMEELVTRPIEQAMSAVAGLERLESTSQEGSSRVTLNFAWGIDLNEAADDVRNRLDRVRGRLPEEADAPVMFKFDPNQQPIMGIGVEGDYDRVTLREIAENVLSQRFERVPGVAQVQINGGLRRQIHVELTREKIMALDLSVDRVVNLLRSENQNIPVGEIDEGDMTYLVRSQGQFETLDQIRNLVILTRQGVPGYLKDLADVRDTTEDIRSVLRINGRPGKQTMTLAIGLGENVSAGRSGIAQSACSARNPHAAAGRARRQLDLHQALHRGGQGSGHARRSAGHRDHLPVPAQRALDNHHLHLDPDFDHRHVRAALLRRLHAEYDDLRRARARRRDDCRCVHRRAREHVPAHGARQGPDAGLD
jgi:hypothetical protein